MQLERVNDNVPFASHLNNMAYLSHPQIRLRDIRKKTSYRLWIAKQAGLVPEAACQRPEAPDVIAQLTELWMLFCTPSQPIILECFRVKHVVLTRCRCAQPPVCIRTHKNDDVRTR